MRGSCEFVMGAPGRAQAVIVAVRSRGHKGGDGAAALVVRWIDALDRSDGSAGVVLRPMARFVRIAKSQFNTSVPMGSRLWA
jgi:hypothetical protein